MKTKILFWWVMLLPLYLEAQNTSLSVGGKVRNLFVYVPAALPDNRPLVISLHGLNQDINYQKNQAKWELVADTAKFVVVYPAGENNSWDISGTKDTDFILAIIESMVDRFKIDRNRVYVTGFSMGGMMCYHTANKIAGKIAAVGPVSGYLFGREASSSRPMPIIHVHGTADDVVHYEPYNNQEGIAAFLQKWRTWNKCPAAATVIDPYPAGKPASNASWQSWGPCDNSAVALISLRGKGHWHSIDPAGVHTTIELWNFLKKYTLSYGKPEIRLLGPALDTTCIAPATIRLVAAAADADGKVAHVNFYQGNILLSTVQTAPYTFNWTNVAAGAYTLRAVAVDNEGKTAEASVQVKVHPVQTPFAGKAQAIPGIIQAEAFDEGGNGNAYFDDSPGSSVTPLVSFRTSEDVDLETCMDEAGGYNIGFATAGEWLEYTVEVSEAGMYDLDLRVACNGAGRSLALSFGAAGKPMEVQVPNTGGWQTWETVPLKNVSLAAGSQIMRLTIGASDYVNVNYIKFTKSVVAALDGNAPAIVLGVHPNPFDYVFEINAQEKFHYTLTDLSGHTRMEGVGLGKFILGETLESGCYLLQLTGDQKLQIVKVCKK